MKVGKAYGHHLDQVAKVHISSAGTKKNTASLFGLFPLSGLRILPLTHSHCKPICSLLPHYLEPSSLTRQGLVCFIYLEGAGQETDVSDSSKGFYT